MATIGFNVRDMISPALLKTASAETLRRALRAGGTVLARAARLSWKEPGRRPGQWVPLAPATIKGKGHGKILYDTGHLQDSITLGEVTGTSATVGTDAPYAPFHQFGTRKMDARPFIPADESGQLTERAAAEIAAAMEAVIRAAVR